MQIHPAFAKEGIRTPSHGNRIFSYHQAETMEWPNIAFQPTPLRVERDRTDFVCYHMLKAFPIYRPGAAERQR